MFVALAIAAISLAAVSSASAAERRPAAGCTTVVKGAPWKIKGLGAGSSYTVKVIGYPCATARTWVVRFTHERSSVGAMRGPAGFRCDTLASKLSGDLLAYDGSCQKGTPAKALIVWAPKPA